MLENSSEELVVSPYVVAELDYLVATRLGVEVELGVLGELAGGAWELPAVGPDDLNAMMSVIKKDRDQEVGVADSNVVLAARYRTRTVATWTDGISMCSGRSLAADQTLPS